MIFHGPTLHVWFHKSGLEHLLRKNVFSSEITDVVKGVCLTKMKICLAKREKPAKKRKTRGSRSLQMKLEAAFSRTTNATSAGSDDSAFVVLLKAAIWLDVVFIDLIVIFS